MDTKTTEWKEQYDEAVERRLRQMPNHEDYMVSSTVRELLWQDVLSILHQSRTELMRKVKHGVQSTMFDTNAPMPVRFAVRDTLRKLAEEEGIEL